MTEYNKYVMHAIFRQTGQRCSLRDLVGWVNSDLFKINRTFETSSINQVQTDEARQVRFPWLINPYKWHYN